MTRDWSMHRQFLIDLVNRINLLTKSDKCKQHVNKWRPFFVFPNVSTKKIYILMDVRLRKSVQIRKDLSGRILFTIRWIIRARSRNFSWQSRSSLRGETIIEYIDSFCKINSYVPSSPFLLLPFLHIPIK